MFFYDILNVMFKYEERKFNIPELKGISKKSIEEHLKLYAGYVKNINDALEGKQDIRRIGFEFNGMRNHEFYFRSLEGGSTTLTTSGPLQKAIVEEFGSWDAWLSTFKSIAITRGVGWAMLYYDPIMKKLINTWVDEQHLGQLNSCQLILGLDMWEHAFVYDYQSSGKKQYIEDFFANLNWEVIEENYKNASK